jgi:hypothetical protein
MVMGMKNMHNILTSYGQMTPISQLGPCCDFCDFGGSLDFEVEIIV